MNIKKSEFKNVKVISYNYVGKDPENNAWQTMLKWAKENNILQNKNIRFFGFNNPSPSKESDVYGYEVCITVDNDVKSDIVKNKVFTGGLYAVCSVEGKAIDAAWREFSADTWFKDNNYTYEPLVQCIEEHITDEEGIKEFLESDNPEINWKDYILYFPIKSNK